MTTTGTVGGWSCGRVVSSSRGMAKACTRAGTKEERQKCGYASRYVCKQASDMQRLDCSLSPCFFFFSWLEFQLFEQVRTSLLSLFLSTILLSHVSSDPDAKGTFIHPVIVPLAMTLPVCLGIRARGTSVTKHTPAFLSAALSTSTCLSNMARGEVCL